MQEDMNLSINGQSQVPPGFRFHPTEEELLHYYLRKKVAYEKIDLDVIREVDLNKLEPWDIQEKCKIGSTPQNDWYFFSHKDKKYPTGTRTNRATAAGFWKATGRDKIIYSGFKRIGLRKTLVFYKGRAPHGQKSDWIMHEYRLDESNHDIINPSCSMGESMTEDGWVVCRVFRKKNYHKTLDSPKSSPPPMDSKLSHEMLGSSNDMVLDQILLYMGRTCKMENESPNHNNMRFFTSGNTNTNINDVLLQERFMHLPRLENNTTTTLPSIPINGGSSSSSSSPFDHFKSCYQTFDDMMTTESEAADPSSSAATLVHNTTKTTGSLHDWASFDRLVASQLNGHDHNSQINDTNAVFNNLCNNSGGDDQDVHLSNLHSQRSNQVYNTTENDLWSFTKSSSSPSSSSDPLCHLSV